MRRRIMLANAVGLCRMKTRHTSAGWCWKTCWSTIKDVAMDSGLGLCFGFQGPWTRCWLLICANNLAAAHDDVPNFGLGCEERMA